MCRTLRLAMATDQEVAGFRVSTPSELWFSSKANERSSGGLWSVIGRKVNLKGCLMRFARHSFFGK